MFRSVERGAWGVGRGACCLAACVEPSALSGRLRGLFSLTSGANHTDRRFAGSLAALRVTAGVVCFYQLIKYIFSFLISFFFSFSAKVVSKRKKFVSLPLRKFPCVDEDWHIVYFQSSFGSLERYQTSDRQNENGN